MTETTSYVTSPTIAAPREDSAPTGGLTILHVEDNLADALLTQEYVRGVAPDVEFDSAVRLSEVTRERASAADCAILDLSLPDASGLEALVALRAMAEDLPIIVLTGFDDLEVGLSGLRYGADDFLIKNHVDGFTLQRAVGYAIERRRLMARVVAVATLAAGAEAAAEAALQDASQNRTSLTLALPGTHQVAVRIGDETAAYELVCETCGWEAEHAAGDHQSWHSRSLDRTLLSHLAFGADPQPVQEPTSTPSPSTPSPSSTSASTASTPDDAPSADGSTASSSTAKADADSADSPAVSRRLFFCTRPWSEDQPTA